MTIDIASELYLSVTNKCALTCDGCCTRGFRTLNPSYDLGIKELEKFLTVTKLSKYKYEFLIIIGLGEPTMWSNLEEGLKLINEYKPAISEKLCLVTNGHDLKRLEPFIGKELDEVYLSIYPETYDRVIKQGEELKKKFPDNFFFSYEGCSVLLDDQRIIRNFFVYKDPEDTLPKGGNCECPGPLFHDGFIYPLCGKGVSVSLFEKYGKELRKALVVDYLKGTYFMDKNEVDNWKPPCTLEACRHCSCNSLGYDGGEQPVFSHSMK